MAEAKAKKTKATKEASAEAEEVITTPNAPDVQAEVSAASPETSEPADQPTSKPTVAKAGKRSEKALEAEEAKTAKEKRKAAKVVGEAAEGESKPRQAYKPTRSHLERRGKSFRKLAEQIEKDKVYSLTDALALATKTNPVKFDATVELHVNLNVDPRHADQNIRDNIVLPQGTGKTVRVAVFADDSAPDADISGVEAVTKLLEKGTLDFDILIATPAQMPKLGKYARSLGPKGLMPNPKSGTVTTNVAKAVAEAKAGRVEYRVDSTGIVHLGIGKVSFGAAKLQENAQTVLASIRSNKPASVKSNYVKAVHLTTTMGPSIKVNPTEL